MIRPPVVLQLIDTLEAGGAERVALALANGLGDHGVRPTLATTRRQGVLATKLSPLVPALHLGRRRRFDLLAAGRLWRFCSRQHVDVVHAHGTSLWAGCFLRVGAPHRGLVWHVHSGQRASGGASFLRRQAAAACDRVVTVSEPLAVWAQTELRLPWSHVEYIPNFAPASPDDRTVPAELPGKQGLRIVAVANLRPVKDHRTLLHAMGILRRSEPDAHLILVGADADAELRRELEASAAEPALAGGVTFLGPRHDIDAVLAAADVGVLSSRAEGFPMTLLEYGRAGLPVVATDVGQCRDILDDGAAGFLVAPAHPEQLALALGRALGAEGLVKGRALRCSVEARFSAHAILSRWSALYRELLRAGRGGPAGSIRSDGTMSG